MYVKTFFLSALVLAYGRVPAETPSPLQTLVQEALRNNPDLKAARFKAQASAALAKGQKALDPPQFGVEFFQTPVGSFPNPLLGQQEIDYSLSQMFPFPGKLAPMARAGTERGAMLAGEAAALEWKIVRQVKSTYYELYNLRRQRELNGESRQHLGKIASVAQKRYEVEPGRYAELLRAQAELSRLSADSLRLQQQERSAAAMLNAALNRAPGTPVEIADTVAAPEVSWTFAQLGGLAEKRRPELRAMDAGRRMAREEAVAGRREFYPDFMLRLMYKDMLMTSDYWALMANVIIPAAPWSFSLPGSKYQKAMFAQGQAEEEYQSMRNMVQAQVQAALSSVESNQSLVRLYRDVTLPKARQALESALAGYQAGTLEFSMLMDTWHMLTMAKTDYSMAMMNLLQSQADLEAACAARLEEIPAELSKGEKK